MVNDSFNLFVSSFASLSINGLKENAENLHYYPIPRRKVELYLFQSTHREWESFLCRFLQMLSTAATIKVSFVYLSAVFFALLTCWLVQFSKIFGFVFSS